MVNNVGIKRQAEQAAQAGGRFQTGDDSDESS